MWGAVDSPLWAWPWHSISGSPLPRVFPAQVVGAETRLGFVPSKKLVLGISWWSVVRTLLFYPWILGLNPDWGSKIMQVSKRSLK